MARHLAPRLDGGRRRLLASLPLLVTGLGLQPALADPRVARASRTLMGTRVDITFEARHADAAQPAIAAAWSEMERLAAMMSRYRRGNAVHALQLAAGVQPVRVEPEMLRVLQAAQRVSELSAGRFDITVGAFSKWGFDPAQETIPSTSDIAEEIPLIGYRDVQINESENTAYLRRRGMRVDLGGIAKLPILQAGMAVLQRYAPAGALINGGGDVLASGQLQGRDWRIGLRDPRNPQQLLGTLALRDGVVAASGDYERGFVRNGHRYHHILDPKTGWPSTGVHGVALLAQGVDAVNGLGAAVMVAGADTGRRLLATRQGVEALIVGADQRLWLSPGLGRRLQAA